VIKLDEIPSHWTIIPTKEEIGFEKKSNCVTIDENWLAMLAYLFLTLGVL